MTKILEKNGIENTSLDAARFNRFCAGYKDGIIKGSFSESRMTLISSNVIQVEKGEILISGFRLILSETTYTFNTFPSSPIRYQIIVQIQIDNDMQPEYTISVQPVSALIKENLFDENADKPIYQVELGRFSLDKDGVTDLVPTLDVISGGSAGDIDFNIGDISTEKIAYEFPAEVDINKRFDEATGKHYLDFKFNLPIDLEREIASRTGTIVKERGQTVLEFNADKKADKEDLDNEISFRQAMQEDLQSQIIAETNNRTDAVSDLQAQINSKAKKSEILNPNLLINGDFRVNQRGQNTYSGTKIFGVDRWQIRNADVTVNSDYTLTIQNKNSQFGGITQSYEFPNELLGKTVTFSVKLTAINTSKYVYMGIGDSSDGLMAGTTLKSKTGLTVGVNSLTFTLPETLKNSHLNFFINNDAGATNSTDNFTIEWVKLELGEIATPFSPRPYAEELALCQRYYYRDAPNQSYSIFGSTFLRKYNDEYGLCAFVLFNLPVTMRLTPTFSKSGNFRNNNVDIGVTDRYVVWAGSTNRTVEVAFTVNKGTVGSAGSLEANNDKTAYVAFDAEIY